LHPSTILTASKRGCPLSKAATFFKILKSYAMKEQVILSALRNASDPYTIPLGRDDYYLSKEALHNVIDSGLTRKKGWYSPTLKVSGFKKGKLKMKNSYIDTTYELIVDIEKDKFQVACSCGQEVETLCIHAFKALDRLCWYEGTDYFEQFRPDGLYEMSVKHKKHFRKRNSYYGRDIQPKETLGAVYKLSDTPRFDDAMRAFTILPAKRPIGKSEADVLCYMVVSIRRKEHPPFVLPCMGKLNKAGTEVKSFYPFLTGLQKEYAHLLTDEQKFLNEQCLALFKEAEKLPGRLFSRYEEPVDISRYTAYFSAWEKLWPLLQKQSHVFTCGIYRKRDLRGKPPKSLTRQVTLSGVHPQLFFQLTDKGPFFQLEMKGKLANKTIRHYELPMLFLMQDEENNLHLLASPVDAYIAEWMKKANHRVTVFKEYFKDFEKNFLSPLQVHYEVNRIKSASKK
jgi:hypothetical protein